MITEIIRFLVFLVCLFLVVTMITTIRGEDKSFLYADSAMSKEDILELAANQSYSKYFFKSFQSLFVLDFGNTESGESVSSHILKKIIPTLYLSLFSIIIGSVSFCIWEYYRREDTKRVILLILYYQVLRSDHVYLPVFFI